MYRPGYEADWSESRTLGCRCFCQTISFSPSVTKYPPYGRMHFKSVEAQNTKAAFTLRLSALSVYPIIDFISPEMKSDWLDARH
ncbi:hypothetical protein TNCV_3267361 [Trichonephila clavipes]|nr:hypothetical protein TNCV_3267361 [Trichonephila clavipes]